MGKFTEQAMESARNMAAYQANEVLFATTLDRALEAAGVEIREDVWASAYSPVLTLTMTTKELETDRAYMTAIRRALGVPRMDRTFSETEGRFRFHGKSTSLFHREQPIELNFNAGANGCTLERITETKEVVRFKAVCADAVEGDA